MYLVKVEGYLTSKLIKTLQDNGFQVFVQNVITGEIAPFSTREKIIYLNYFFLCLYNGRSLPSQEVFKQMEEDHYAHYTIEKR